MSTTKPWDYKPYGLGTKHPFKYPVYTDTPIGGGGKTPSGGKTPIGRVSDHTYTFDLSQDENADTFLEALCDAMGKEYYDEISERGTGALKQWWDGVRVDDKEPTELTTQHFKSNTKVTNMKFSCTLQDRTASITVKVTPVGDKFKKMVYVTRQALKDHREELQKLFEGTSYATINVSTAHIGDNNFHENEYRLKGRISSVSPLDLIQKAFKKFAQYSKINTLVFYLGDDYSEYEYFPDKCTDNEARVNSLLEITSNLDSSNPAYTNKDHKQTLYDHWLPIVDSLKPSSESSKVPTVDLPQKVSSSTYVARVKLEDGEYQYALLQNNPKFALPPSDRDSNQYGFPPIIPPYPGNQNDIPSDSTKSTDDLVKFLMDEAGVGDNETIRIMWSGQIEILKYKGSGTSDLHDTHRIVVLHVTLKDDKWSYAHEYSDNNITRLVKKINNSESNKSPNIDNSKPIANIGTNNNAPIQLVININNPQYVAALFVLFIALFFVRG